MQDAGYAALQIIPSFKGFQPALEHGTHGALIGAGTSGGRKYGDAAGRSLVSSFTTHARRAALVGASILAAGIGAAGYAAFKLGKSSLAEAEEARRVGALTAQVIKTTGQAAGVTAMEVGNLAEQLSNKTGVDDEVIQRGANLILTFKNIRNEVGQGNSIFNRAVKITEDMSAAMAGGQGGGQLDLKSSSILVGKALNDPAKGLTALTRVGVTFTEQQKKNIEKLLEQNKVSEAQKVILGELKSEFGGAAAAQATLGDKVDVAWGNIQERLGKVILPLVHDVQRAFLREGVPALERFSDWFQEDGLPAIEGFVSDAKPKIKDFISDVRPLAEEVLPAVSGALGDVRDILGDAAPYAKDLVSAFNDLPDWAKKGAVIGGLGAYAGGKAGMFSRGGLGSSILGGITKAAPLPVYVVNDMPDLPGGPRSKIPTKLSSAAAFGPQAAALALTGYVAYQTAKTIAPGVGRSAATVALPAGGPSMGSSSGDWAAQHPDAARANVGGEALWQASLADDWTKVLRLTREYDGLLGTTAASTNQLRGAGHRFAKEFGVGLEDANRILGGDIPNSLGKVRSAIDKADARQRGLTRSILGSKAVGDEFVGTLGVIANDWRAKVDVETGDTEARLNRILTLMNTIAHQGGLQQAGALPGGPSPAPTPRKKQASGRPSGRRGTQINIHLDGKKVGEVFDERIGTTDDLVAERRRAGAPE